MKKLIFSAIFFLILHLNGISQSYKIQYGAAIELGNINDSRITEASGIAASYNTSGGFWVHNDSGDGPNIYLIDSTGRVLSSGSLLNANSRDWEDIASFVIDGTPYLLLADIGDNPVNKSEYWLYIIEEPIYNAQSPNGNSYPLVRTITFQYENGPKDCESVAVDVHEGKIILVSKSGNGEGERFVYEIPLSVEPGNETTTANIIGQFSMDGPTAMDISNDGQRAIVLTYQDAYEFTRVEGNSWEQAFAETPRLIDMPSRPGGEAIAYGRNATDLYLVREGTNSPVWFINGQVEQGAVFQVDMFEETDILNNQVYLNIQGVDSVIIMTDTDEDMVYACKVDLPLDSMYTFYFSYQQDNGAGGMTINEELSAACSNAEGYREIYLAKQNAMLKPYIFGSCSERPNYITLAVDMHKIDDMNEGGAVWVHTIVPDSLFLMTDANHDSIFTFTTSGPKGSSLTYKFCYQNGINPETDIVCESIPAECSNNGGFREYLFQDENVSLLSVEFGTCQEALPEGFDITDLEGTQIVGSNDAFPWEGPTSGSGSPDGQEVDKLIDNNINTKYLVRAVDSWVDIVSGNLTKVNAYTITSGSDVPSRDPRSWTFQGWNPELQEWETIHSVTVNPEWQERLQRQSWYFQNDNWYGKYRLHITEINGNTQELMQMAELQIFGEVGEKLEWSSIATLDYLEVEGAELTPAFDPDIFDYEAILPYGSIKISISATPTDEKAQVSGTGTFLLAILTQTPQITVLAEDGINSNTYTVNYTIADQISGIKDAEYMIKLFPNPSNGIFYVSNTVYENIEFAVFDCQGVNIFQGHIDGSQTAVDLTQFTAGFYYILIRAGNTFEKHKVVLCK